MKRENRKQTVKRKSAKRQFARAIARWDNEGGAPKSPAQESREQRAVLAAEEERILRCLGAALIMQWNELPRGIQRSLFEYAVSMGEPRETAALKGRIARFLHKHKDAKRR
jgi:hypothetical protein